MAVVVFYEKPGCANNAKQKQWLRESGHDVIEQNILTHYWSANELLRFFNTLPVPQWFNQSSPRVKHGEIKPETLEPKQAIALMLADPLLIRRPLMLVNGVVMVGFDRDAVDRWIGLSKKTAAGNLEACSKITSKPSLVA
jgi:nitrogenase-associated protein